MATFRASQSGFKHMANDDLENPNMKQTWASKILKPSALLTVGILSTQVASNSLLHHGKVRYSSYDPYDPYAWLIRIVLIPRYTSYKM